MEQGERVKYLAVCVLSLVAHVTADGASIIDTHLPATSASPLDGALAALLAGALVAIKLRRRQKSLRMPRPLS